MEDDHSFVKTDEEAAADLTTLLKSLYNGNTKLQKGPLFAVAESYGKLPSLLPCQSLKLLTSGELAINFGVTQANKHASFFF
ncbi:hypothetical protein HPP92_029115 [Vanilla planifolia]|uniref:Uncharacterized protein n=1 Tax=Vanilla planifolia TaxID=51239 RepID=A0A835P3H3_VANPL|nr:hypothetical protein HPP92_029115 [Vanilla planifolia]